MTDATTTQIPASSANLPAVLPFWCSMFMFPIAWVAAFAGGFWVILPLAAAWWLFVLLDLVVGKNVSDADPQTDHRLLLLYETVTWVWVPLQYVMIFGLIWYATHSTHLGTAEQVFLFASVGALTGAIGINYSHELMHRPGRFEGVLADLLLASVLYSHFRSEHMLVHHRYVATPRDTVTARYNENFWRFFLRVVRSGLGSAWRAEAAMLARKQRPWWDSANPFWRYAALQGACLLLALTLGGWFGVLLFGVQAVVAIFQLELVNYVEHYGMTRRHLGDGRYEPTQPHHSWNSTKRVSNWFLINLQRHSDHHVKPDRPFPLLQSRVNEAPELPTGYPLMTLIALVPPVWRRLMNPRVREWRRTYYSDIEDWTPYKMGTNPMPR